MHVYVGSSKMFERGQLVVQQQLAVPDTSRLSTWLWLAAAAAEQHSCLYFRQ
jgi:hypothetical protein